uniref:Nucleotide-binding alpha-beta plait domain-containing protein n=1 Tax=Tanacetum cinerariifolium TaxID=118510 RepID=A0A6L2M5N4_TANCI|nr:nucleotide-binding alpha-beta plait domain-containing protein [Tanacetum cinerariifolium]
MVIMGSQRSKEDDVQNIFTSVFVTNFPDQYGAKDLWNSCKVCGQVVNAYIPDRRSKAGKRFGFVRFIKVFDVERLINNLCTIWVGRFKLHANVAWFQREPMNKQKDKVNANGTSKVNAASRKNGDWSKRTVNSYVYAVTGYHGYKEPIDNIPTMVLDETCLNNEEYSLSLLGKVKEFASLTNLKVVLAKEGFSSIEIKYMGGFWVMIVFQDDEAKKRFQSNVVVGSWFSQIIQAHNEFNLEESVMWVEIEGVPFLMESFKMVYCGKVCWVRAIEVPGWVPDFDEGSDVETNDGSHEDEVQDINSDAHNNLEGDSDIDEVLETCFEDESNKQWNADDDVLEDNRTRNHKEDEVHWGKKIGTEVQGAQIQMYQLKILKEKIRKWNCVYKESKNCGMRNLKVELNSLDSVIDNGNGTYLVINRRMEVIRLMQEMEKADNLEVAQKAKIKWAIEGDENSKYYHGVLNKKISLLTIRGVLADGIWIESPQLVKKEFFLLFKQRFEQSSHQGIQLEMDFVKRLSSD